MDAFFYAIDGDLKLAEDFSHKVWNLKCSINDMLSIIKWLNIYGMYTLADMLSGVTIYHIGTPKMPEFNLKRAIAYTPYMGVDTNKPLMIVFSPFISSIVDKHYDSYGISNLELLHGTLKFPSLNFFTNSNNFNVLHILDEYQVWGMLNFSKYVNNIKNIIILVKPSKIITFGSSAGGFQSLLYGILLNADMSIACSPQTIAFHSYMNKYRSEINRNYAFSLSNYCYIPKIMKFYDSQTVKIIFFSSGNSNDVWHYSLIKDMNNTSSVVFDAGNAHNLFEIYGNKFMYEQIMSKINTIL